MELLCVNSMLITIYEICLTFVSAALIFKVRINVDLHKGNIYDQCFSSADANSQGNLIETMLMMTSSTMHWFYFIIQKTTTDGHSSINEKRIIFTFIINHCKNNFL